MRCHHGSLANRCHLQLRVRLGACWITYECEEVNWKTWWPYLLLLDVALRKRNARATDALDHELWTGRTKHKHQTGIDMCYRLKSGQSESSGKLPVVKVVIRPVKNRFAISVYRLRLKLPLLFVYLNLRWLLHFLIISYLLQNHSESLGIWLIAIPFS